MKEKTGKKKSTHDINWKNVQVEACRTRKEPPPIDTGKKKRGIPPQKRTRKLRVKKATDYFRGLYTWGQKPLVSRRKKRGEKTGFSVAAHSRKEKKKTGPEINPVGDRKKGEKGKTNPSLHQNQRIQGKKEKDQSR